MSPPPVLTVPTTEDLVIIPTNITMDIDTSKFHILEVNPWTRTPIFLDVGTFYIPLSTYVLIKTHVKWVPIPRSDTYTGIRIVHIQIYIIVS